MKIIITESQYKQILKEESLVTTLLNRIKDDGWIDTAELVGGSENLLDIIGDNKENVILFLLSHYTDLHIKKYGGSIQYCYLLWESKKHIAAEHHAIWLNTEGELVDVTPQDKGTLALDWDNKVSVILTDIEYNGYSAPPMYIFVK